jgi:hypothetical protein
MVPLLLIESAAGFVGARAEEAIKPRNAGNCFVVAMIGRKPEVGARQTDGGQASEVGDR